MLGEASLSETRSLRDRIGGEWSLKWQTFLLNSLLALLVLFTLQDMAFSGFEVFIRWIMVWLLSTATVGLYLYVAGETVLKNRRIAPVKVSRVIIVNALIGIIYTLTNYYLQRRFDLSGNVDFSTSIVSNTVLVLWWSITLSIFLDFASESKREREKLIEDGIQIRIAELQESDIALRLRHDISQEVSQQLNLSKQTLEASMRNLGEESVDVHREESVKWQEIGRLLESIARDSIRPLSKNLWQKDSIIYPKVRWRAFFRKILREQNFQPLVIAIIDLVGAAPSTLKLFGTEHATPLIMGVTGLILGIGYLFNYLMQLFPGKRIHFFILGILAFEGVIVPLRTHFRELWIPGSASHTWQIGQVVLGVLVIFMASGFSAFRSLDKQAKAIFSHEVDIKSTASIARALEIAKFAQESSRILHGAIQSRLVSCAMVIEKAAKSGNRKEFTLALQQAYEVLDTPLPQQIQPDSIALEVARKVSLWHGLCEFQTEVNLVESAGTSKLSAILGRIVEEGISNSIRHGKATKIEIRVTGRNLEEIEVVIIDNGVGFSKIKSGIGTALLQQATKGDWSLISNHGTTVLKATVSIDI